MRAPVSRFACVFSLGLFGVTIPEESRAPNLYSEISFHQLNNVDVFFLFGHHFRIL